MGNKARFCSYCTRKHLSKSNERLLIVKSIRYVDDVIISIDNDKTVCKTLEYLRPNIFAKGGDRFSTEIPESGVCNKLAIKIVDGLGDKVQSSSSLLKEIR